MQYEIIEVDHSPVIDGTRVGVDVRLLDLIQIYDEELPRMGGIKVLKTMRETNCISIVAIFN